MRLSRDSNDEKLCDIKEPLVGVAGEGNNRESSKNDGFYGVILVHYRLCWWHSATWINDAKFNPYEKLTTLQSPGYKRPSQN